MSVGNPEVYYRLLGLEPGASYEEVKHAYRELAKAWHPDRFARDAHLQQQALEKIKEINNAYARLRTLHPDPEAHTAHAKSGPRHASPPSAPGRSHRSPTRTWTIPPWLVALVAFVILRLCFDYRMPSPRLDFGARSRSSAFSKTRITPTSQSGLKARTGVVPAVKTSEKPAPPPFFTVGSTKSEVLTIQGSPTVAGERVWEYGGSRVYFRHGRVARWEIWSRDPLRAQLKPTIVIKIAPDFFTVGSTKDEVLIIQGSPTRFTDRVWEYGYSRVYFAGNRVTRWEVWRGSPLKAKLLPSTPVNLEPAYFSVGSTKDEVLAVQGSPTRFSQRIWEYGQSRIYFDSDRVIRWEEWRGSPLKARLAPTVP